MLNNKPIFLALDFENGLNALHFLKENQLNGIPVKVGMELFYREGPPIILTLKEQGHPIFLDLKLHDIPNTVKNAMRNLSSLGVDVVNVHAAGGKEMMQAAQEGLELGRTNGAKKPVLLAVTQLTSTSEQSLQDELLISASMNETILHYANLARQAGVEGVVCSVHEANLIHEKCGSHFYTVTPGIRLTHGSHHDQVRVGTPALAREKDADALVIGRSVTQATNPREAYHLAKKEWGYANETSFS